jgi:predicted DNA-binding transcriptional regulator AlpA
VIFLRFADLVERRIVRSRMTLKRLIDTQGFPPGRLLTPNCRAWSDEEVDAWIASRPVARKPDTSGRAAQAAARAKASPSSGES